MTKKLNLPALAIVGASLSQFSNVFKGVFLHLWPFLLLYILKDYFLVSSKGSNFQYSNLILISFYVIIALGVISSQVCWIEKVITKQDYKYTIDKRTFVTIGYTILLGFLIFLGVTGVFILFSLMAKNGYIPSGFGIILSILLILFVISIGLRFWLIFPAVAVNNNKTRVKRSWELTKGYHLKLFFIFVGFIITIGIPGAIANMVLVNVGADSITTFLLIMFVVNTLSLLSTLMIAELLGRLFVFFHVPDKINEYI